MIDKRWWVPAFVALAGLALAACAYRPSGPWIAGIADEPEIAKKGGQVVYTIDYANASSETAYSDLYVQVRYDEYLSYSRNADPFPDEIDEKQRELRWKVGTLGPGAEGSIDIGFWLAAEIPRTIYELEVTAKIYSADGERSHSRSEETLIVGHPTPTPTVTNTPRPTSTPKPTSTPGPTRAPTRAG